VLNKLTATGIVVAGITGAILLGGPANAQQLTASAHPIAGCYYPAAYYAAQPAYCNLPIYQYPRYHHHYGWGRWHHGYYPWNGYRFNRFHH
jgi:hypothetical protein